MIEQVFGDRTEQLGIAAAERAAGDEIDHFAQRRVLLVMIARSISTPLRLSDFGGRIGAGAQGYLNFADTAFRSNIRLRVDWLTFSESLTDSANVCKASANLCKA